jgi:hypothetical protein
MPTESQAPLEKWKWDQDFEWGKDHLVLPHETFSDQPYWLRVRNPYGGKETYYDKEVYVIGWGYRDKGGYLVVLQYKNQEGRPGEVAPFDMDGRGIITLNNNPQQIDGWPEEEVDLAYLHEIDGLVYDTLTFSVS